MSSNGRRAPYHPTPTIVEAARALYAQHSVEAIARYDAGAQNLRVTSSRIEELVDEARAQRHKLICFVTGVPGAGKTLVGLNVATRRRDGTNRHMPYFFQETARLSLCSMKHSLVTRLRVRRSNGIRVRKGKVAESIKAFIQNVHHFRDDAIDSTPGLRRNTLPSSMRRNARGTCGKPRASCVEKRIDQGSLNQSPSF